MGFVDILGVAVLAVKATRKSIKATTLDRFQATLRIEPQIKEINKLNKGHGLFSNRSMLKEGVNTIIPLQ